MEVLVIYLTVNEQLCDEAKGTSCRGFIYGGKAGVTPVSNFEFVFASVKCQA